MGFKNYKIQSHNSDKKVTNTSELPVINGIATKGLFKSHPSPSPFHVRINVLN